MHSPRSPSRRWENKGLDPRLPALQSTLNPLSFAPGSGLRVSRPESHSFPQIPKSKLILQNSAKHRSLPDSSSQGGNRPPPSGSAGPVSPGPCHPGSRAAEHSPLVAPRASTEGAEHSTEGRGTPPLLPFFPTPPLHLLTKIPKALSWPCLEQNAKFSIWLPKPGAQPLPTLLTSFPITPSTVSAWAQLLTHSAPTTPPSFCLSFEHASGPLHLLCFSPGALFPLLCQSWQGWLFTKLSVQASLVSGCLFSAPSTPYPPNHSPLRPWLCCFLWPRNQVMLCLTVSSTRQGLCMPSSLLALEHCMRPGMNKLSAGMCQQRPVRVPGPPAALVWRRQCSRAAPGPRRDWKG